MFWYWSSQGGILLYETRLKISGFNSPLPAGLSYKFRWPGALLAWPSKTRTLARSGGCCRLAFWPPSIEKEGLLLVLPFGFENTVLYVSRPLHTVHSRITTVNEDLHTELIYKTQKKWDAPQHLSVGFDIWFAGYETNYWCFIILRQDFFQGKACHLARKKKKKWGEEATHTNTKLMSAKLTRLMCFGAFNWEAAVLNSFTGSSRVM